MSEKNVVILYGSNYGYTERYSNWIAEDLRASDSAPTVTLAPIAEATDELIESADVLIVGASYLGGFLTGAPTLRKRREAMLKVPNRVFFTVCFNGLAVYPREYLDKRVMKSYKEDVAGGYPAFHFRGGLDMERMTSMHRKALGLVKTAYKLKPKQNEYDKQLIEAFDNGGGDFSNREDTKPLIETVLGYLK
ncbi:flavodoxin domain-containing protein [Rothia aerolata]|uniref:Flavodoxin n=1 Tax=Rothia aerolata TaxID=1812262 RepID=A0A917MQ07_9MICC|nr:flavodoxin domain-containing protein [Rothia aerolata]GGH57013.1 flavodoxin [Rothia aerolata]